MKNFTTLTFWLALIVSFSTVPGQETGSETGRSSIQSNHVIRSADEISVVVFGEPDLSVRQTVDGDGNILVPLLGRMNVEGKTVHSVEQRLERDFVDQEYLRKPEVNILLHTQARQEVTVIGQVRRPGPVAMPPNTDRLDILEAIARAGDLTDVADLKKVIVKRKTPDGDFRDLEVNLKPLLDGRDSRSSSQPSFPVYPGDIIVVDDTLW